MTTLTGFAMRLQGPLQAWGGPVIGDDRPSLSFPTRSGVLGLVAACLGIRRDELDRLFALADGARVHARVDAYGSPLVDDQTVQAHPEASRARQTIQSKRTYLVDACFTALVVPGPRSAPRELVQALRTPVFSPYLGRRTCVPSAPLLLADGVSGPDALVALEAVPASQEHSSSDFVDYYLDVEHHPEALRVLPVRDALSGPLPRQFRERLVCHVRRPRPTLHQSEERSRVSVPPEA